MERAFAVLSEVMKMPRNHKSVAALAGVATIILMATMVTMAKSGAVAAPGVQPGSSGSSGRSSTDVGNARDLVHRGHFDSRRDGRAGEVLQSRAAQEAAKPATAVLAMKKSLGVQGLVTIDPLTGSPRQIARSAPMFSPPWR